MHDDPQTEPSDDGASALDPGAGDLDDDLGDAGRSKGAPYIDPTGNL